MIYTGLSDNNGIYEIDNIEKGEYIYQVSKTGYAINKGNVSINNNEDKNVFVKLIKQLNGSFSKSSFGSAFHK
jgi:hypothetical protein